MTDVTSLPLAENASPQLAFEPVPDDQNPGLRIPDSARIAQRSPGETPRAYSAFMTWFQLGHARSHQAVADKLGEGLPTVKNWASKYDWSERLLAFNSGLLQKQAGDQAERQRKQAADWADRLNSFREQEWDAAQKLIAAAQCFLESFGEEDLRNMTLSQVSRALKISSAIGRSALAGAELPESSDAEMSPLQQQLLDAVTRVYGQPAIHGTPGEATAPQPSPLSSPGERRGQEAAS
jgi:hypothetical protein